LQQRAQQHRPVFHAVAQAFQRLGQALEGQPGVGRDEVEVEGDVLHGGRALMQAGFTGEWHSSALRQPRTQMARRSALSAMRPGANFGDGAKAPLAHAAVFADMRHTEMQGEGTTSSESFIKIACRAVSSAGASSY
jgi:hypothetical protein